MHLSIMLVTPVCTLLILYSITSVSASCKGLLLTPYIRQGDITTARELSRVVDEKGIIPTSYAGFITVDHLVGNNLFFWYFPTFNSSDPTAPLLVWLNGGPGESSMIGLLSENGPIQLGKSDSGETIYKRRNNTWVNKFSMLYIDNPVEVGYSYSKQGKNGSRSTQDGIIKDLNDFIKQFYRMFPELLEKDLYIGGHSYAGKYITLFAYEVHRNIILCGSKIRLKGIYLESPVLDTAIQFLELFDLYFTLGYITDAEREKSKKAFKEKLPPFKIQTPSDFGPIFYQNIHENIYTSGVAPDADIIKVMTSDNLRSMLHVGNSSYINYNHGVYLSVILNDFFVSIKGQLTELMNKYKVLIYSGDMDGLITNAGLETIIQSLPWASQAAYTSSSREVWRDKNEVIRGFYTRVANLCRVVIRGAGHRTAMDQSDKTFEIMDQFVKNGCLCGGNSG